MQNGAMNFREGTRLFQIAELLATGMSCKDIAARLDMSPGTVKTYTNQIYRRCNVSSRLEYYQIYNGQLREEETLP